jgi:hypothetical protein
LKQKINEKKVEKVLREGYMAKLFRVKFDCGQSCVFHSRVHRNGKIAENLAIDLKSLSR